MSAYSDWKSGALTDEQYEMECNWEYRREETYLDELDRDYCEGDEEC